MKRNPDNEYNAYIGYLAGWASALLVWLLFIQGTGGF